MIKNPNDINGIDIIIAIICGCIGIFIVVAGLNSMRISKRISNDVAQIEAYVETMEQMMFYRMTNHTAKDIR